jgi:hypothetical protein
MKMRPRSPSRARITVRTHGSRGLRENASWAGRFRSWPTRHELTSEVFEYIEAFYNRIRHPSTLGMLAPLEFENRTLTDGRPSVAASRLRSCQTQIIKI